MIDRDVRQALNLGTCPVTDDNHHSNARVVLEQGQGLSVVVDTAPVFLRLILDDDSSERWAGELNDFVHFETGLVCDLAESGGDHLSVAVTDERDRRTRVLGIDACRREIKRVAGWTFVEFPIAIRFNGSELRETIRQAGRVSEQDCRKDDDGAEYGVPNEKRTGRDFGFSARLLDESIGEPRADERNCGDAQAHRDGNRTVGDDAAKAEKRPMPEI